MNTPTERERFEAWMAATRQEHWPKSAWAAWQARAALASPQTPDAGWLPIESAPKDGSKVLLLWGGRVVYGWWLDNIRTSVPWAGWRQPSMEPMIPGSPTLWQPLPAPPNAEPVSPAQDKGEYPPLPEPARETEGAGAAWRNSSPDYFTADQMRAYIDADRAQRAQPEAQLPGRDPNKPAEEQGLFHKFNVYRTDGSHAPGGKHHGCEYFVLDVKHDAHAKAALTAYAASVRATHPRLADDMIERYGLAAAHPVEQGQAALREPLTNIVEGGEG